MIYHLAIILLLFNIALEHGPFREDKHHDLPIQHADCPVRYVKEPNGIKTSLVYWL